MSERFDLYMAGVGGQGIGLLSELLARAADHGGMTVKGCDTHGLAQRGGMVTSHLRIGKGAHSPLVAPGTADLVIALERYEALRAMRDMLKSGGTLLWYDVAWEPLDVRLGESSALEGGEIEAEAAARGCRAIRVFREALADPRSQNVVLVGELARRGLIPGLKPEHCRAALADLLEGALLERNLALFDSSEASPAPAAPAAPTAPAPPS